uniref:Uncharacterized protein n=1 Tax=Caenorhabditis japonica TaxID=281687 RepID=A0A8R1HXQ9_CAEJA
MSGFAVGALVTVFDVSFQFCTVRNLVKIDVIFVSDHGLFPMDLSNWRHDDLFCQEAPNNCGNAKEI